MLFESPPERMLLRPLFGADLVRVTQCGVENVSGLIRDLRVSESNNQLVIDIETSGVQVCGSNVNGFIDDEEFGMQDLGLIFVDLNPALKQTEVQTLRGQPRDGNVALGAQKQLHSPTSSNHSDQMPAQLPAWQKIRHHDLD